MVKKATSSVSVVVAILKTTQKSLEPTTTANTSDMFTIASIPAKELCITLIQKVDDEESIGMLRAVYERLTKVGDSI